VSVRRRKVAVTLRGGLFFGLLLRFGLCFFFSLRLCSSLFGWGRLGKGSLMKELRSTKVREKMLLLLLLQLNLQIDSCIFQTEPKSHNLPPLKLYWFEATEPEK
jgi:hypothetical protein